MGYLITLAELMIQHFTLNFTNMKKGIVIGALFAAAIIGEVKCVIKAIDCNWEPVGKAEIVYTVASLTGLGCIVGYINIEDK